MHVMQEVLELLIVVSAFFGTLFGIVALLFWLRYRIKALKTRSGTDGEVAKLAQRLAALEKQCAKLQEQVLDAHTLLADEQRQLDHKLTAMLPDAPVAPPEIEGPRKQAQQERARV